MNAVKFYEAPEVLFIDVQSEGVLCQSGSFNPYEEIEL